VFALPVVLIYCQLEGGLGAIRPRRPGWQLARGFLVAGANFGFFYGLSQVPLITAVLLAYVSPVLIVLLSRPLLGERVGLHRWLGVAVGFAGVVAVYRPTDVGLNPGMLAVLASSLCWALLSVSNRYLAGQETSASLTFFTLPVSGLLAAVLTVDSWVEPRALDWALFLIAGLCGGAAHLFVVLAYRHARAATIAPLEYTNLIWAALGAYLFWREMPDSWTWMGGAAILVGGYLAVRVRD